MMRIPWVFVTLVALGCSRPSGCQDGLLDSAFAKKSKDAVSRFFTQWECVIPPISDDAYGLLNDTEKNVYDLYQVFFAPFELGKYSGADLHEASIDEARYCVLPNSISYRIVKTLDEDSIILGNLERRYGTDTAAINRLYEGLKKPTAGSLRGLWLGVDKRDVIASGEIGDFRPQVVCDKVKPLYLSEQYSRLLLDFLGSAHRTVGSKIPGKDEFLKQNIRVYRGHDSGWRLLTYPVASVIEFDCAKENARFDYSVLHVIGKAYFKRQNGSWVLTRAHPYFID